jgi:hypothetical protein
LPSAADRPLIQTQAELDAYFRNVITVALLSSGLGLLFGPILAAVQYRLGGQFLDGAPPAPFADIVGLVVRFFLQSLLFLLVGAAVFLVLALTGYVLDRIVGLALAIVCEIVAVFSILIVLVLRLGIAPALLIRGDGPLESIRHAWQLTRGRYAQMARWWFVTGLLLAIIAGVISGASSAIFTTIGMPLLGQVVNAVLIAPIGLVSAIVFVRLSRLLSGDHAPDPPLPPPPPADAVRAA